MTLSVVIITHNEEANIARTLESVMPLVHDGKGEIIVVDSGSTDRTAEIAQSFGARVFVEPWKGFAAQKNSALEKATGDWILSLDADEEVEGILASEIDFLLNGSAATGEERLRRAEQLRYIHTRRTHLQFKQARQAGLRVDRPIQQAESDGVSVTFLPFTGFYIPRKNHFLGRWIEHGGYWPDPKLRLFRKGVARFEDRLVHEDAQLQHGISGQLRGALLHHSYPTISDYIEHMNRYSTFGAQMAVSKGPVRFSVISIAIRPWLTFIYNYFFRLGFLDGHEGFLLHVNHAVYVSWKYAKAWELARKP